ncbi:unnamed protein product [Schistosoma intercalatum]|nr:unnamed protein product [Schistosoma intercalatum]
MLGSFKLIFVYMSYLTQSSVFHNLFESTIFISTILQAYQAVTSYGLCVRHRCSASVDYSIKYSLPIRV